jgi:hypothetical protein
LKKAQWLVERASLDSGWWCLWFVKMENENERYRSKMEASVRVVIVVGWKWWLWIYKKYSRKAEWMRGCIWWTYDGNSQESDVIGVKVSVVKEEG